MSEYIGKSFRVLAADGLHLPTGHVPAGDIFTYTEEHEAYGLGPDLWLKCHQVEATSDTSRPSRKAEPPAPLPIEVPAAEDVESVPDVGTGDAAAEVDAIEVDPFGLVGRTVTRSGRHHASNARP